MELIMVTGGARSGKSSFAQSMAGLMSQRKEGVVYMATSIIGDQEMRRRVELHRLSRPSQWQTVEEAFDLPAALERVPGEAELVLVDCLTMWLSNMLLLNHDNSGQQFRGSKTGLPPGPAPDREPASGSSLMQNEAALEKEILERLEQFISKLDQKSLSAILVTNEVGWGIVPEHYLGRLFRDLAGRCNQKVAAKAGEVYFVVSGIAVKIKG